MQKNLVKITLISIISLFLFWTPWIMKINSFWGIEFGKKGMEHIVANFDGLNFLIVAKSLYNPEIINEINRQFPTGNSPVYFTAHYPIFSLVVRGFETFMSAPYALLTTIIVSNILLAAVLYWFFLNFLKNKNIAVIAAATCLFLPARMLSVRSVGSNEPLFMAFVLSSLIMASKNKHLLASILGSFAILTRSPGILLFGAYGLAILASYRLDILKSTKAIIPYLLMPMTLLGLFAYYGFQYGDFLAYFNSGDNLHLFFPPFTIFSNTASWISGMWREDLIYQYLFYGLGITFYIRSLGKACGVDKLSVGAYGLVYGLVLILVSHRDLARYALPLAPIAMLGYAPLLLRKEVKVILVILVIPIYLLGWQFVVANAQPINDWGAILIR